MKKTYKPMARTEKASQMFKKKTLNVNDDLNIKHDEDDIENVDAYWSTAMSVIGNSTIDSIDDTVVTEQSDTLFNINNIRKSIRGDCRESAEDLYRECVNESMKKDLAHPSHEIEDSFVQETAPEHPAFGESGGSCENFENSIKKKVRRLTLKGNADSLDALKEKQPSSDSDNESDSSKPERLDSSNSEFNNEPKDEMPNSGFEMELDSLLDYSDTKESVVDQGDESAAELKSLSSFLSKPRSSSTPQRVEDYKTKRATTNAIKMRGSLEILEVPSTIAVNSVRPLICSCSMDTAVMNLDYLAYVENHETANAFSIYVIKGKAELVVNSVLRTISKGNIAVIEKGDIYSLNCLSRNGALLLLSYVL